MTSKERVHRSVAFGTPDKLPIYYFNRDTARSDIVRVRYAADPAFTPQAPGQTEWGFCMHSLDETMGQPCAEPFAESLDGALHYHTPNPDVPARYAPVRTLATQQPDRYLIASLGITGFGILTSLRGFTNTLMDLYLDHKAIMSLFEKVVAFENGVITQLGRIDGVDAISFSDDWGSQSGLFMNPDDWRKWFKPYYKQQFALVHSYGKHVFFHCCGKINAILDDLIEIGADILNLNQPDLLGLPALRDSYRGRVCFSCPVDHQTVAVRGTDSEIAAYVQQLGQCLSTPRGGYLCHIEEYHTMGMREESYQSICRAFESLSVSFSNTALSGGALPSV